MIFLLYHNQKSITQKGLACSYYTTSSENSKMNLPCHEKTTNGQNGLSILSWLSSFLLHQQRLPVSSDVFTIFSDLPIFAENDIIHSWPLPNSHGKPFGEGFGK
jgi:hypothetical protein